MKKVILVDLGGVLINLNWSSHVGTLLGKNLTRQEMLEQWLSMRSTHKYEEGITDFETFHDEFQKETGKSIKFEIFAKEFDAIIGPVKDDCINILKELKKYGTLALLSNSNERHIEQIAKTGLFNDFDMLFMSHLMGMSKPSPIIFEAVRKALNCSAKDIYFFDDSPTNVDAAIRFGFNAYRVESPQEILKIIAK